MKKEIRFSTIREIAAEMLRLVKEIPGNPYEHTLAAFDL
jgi:hypothetical protein